MKRFVNILLVVALLGFFAASLPINHDRVPLRWWGGWEANVPLTVLLLFTFVLGMASAIGLITINFLTKAVDHRTKFQFPGAQRKATTLLRKGEKILKRGKEAEAESLFKQAAEAYSGATAPRQALANLYLSQNKKHAALTELKIAAAIEPKNTGMLIEIARLSLETGDSPRAIKAIETVFEIEPGNAFAQRIYPKALAEAALWEDAAKAQETLLKNMPKPPPVEDETALSAYRTEHARSLAGADEAKALKILKAVLEQAPTFLAAALTASEIYLSKNKPKDAFEVLAKAFEKRPEPFIYRKLAGMNGADSFTRAEELAEEALKFNPRLHALRIARARARLMNGRIAEALDELGKISGEPTVELLILKAGANLKAQNSDEALCAIDDAIEAVSVEYICSVCGWRRRRWSSSCAHCKSFNTMTTPVE